MLFNHFSQVPIRERIGLPIAMAMLIFFAAIGIDIAIRPQRHMNGYLRRGGRLLQEWNAAGTTFAGLLFTVVSIGLLYEIIRIIWTEWLH
jgi:hypothetical protein